MSAWESSPYSRANSYCSGLLDVAEVASRIVRFMSGANLVMQLPLAEAIITNKEKGFVSVCCLLFEANGDDSILLGYVDIILQLVCLFCIVWIVLIMNYIRPCSVMLKI